MSLSTRLLSHYPSSTSRVLQVIIFLTIIGLLFLISQKRITNAMQIGHATSRLSVAFDGGEANRRSYKATISPDKKYIAFASDANNLIPGDTNNYYDIFLLNIGSGTIQIVSVNTSGEQQIKPTFEFSVSVEKPSLSNDGRYVAFASKSRNLVLGDTNSVQDIFVRDTLLGTTKRVSVSSSGNQANDASYNPSLSADGRYVTFHSSATNLVPSPDSNGASQTDVFVYDTLSETTTLVSISDQGIQGDKGSEKAVITPDGRYITFQSKSTNLVPGDLNFDSFFHYGDDIFVYDTTLNTINRVSVSSSGGEGNQNSSQPSISADGRYVTFQSTSDNLVDGDDNQFQDIFVHDRSNGTTKRVSVDSLGNQANGDSLNASISADGRYISYLSYATNIDMMATLGLPIATGYAQFYIYDQLTHSTRVISVTENGLYPNGGGEFITLSSDGQKAVFDTLANNLVALDSNNSSDIYIANSYINIATPQVSNNNLFISGSTGTGLAIVTGTGEIGEQVALILWQYDSDGILQHTGLYTTTITQTGSRSIPVTIAYDTGSRVDLIPSLYDTVSNGGTSRKAGPASLSSFYPTLLTRPSVYITSTHSGMTTTTPISISITFSEDVNDFTIDDITVTNGDKSQFTAVSASVYTLDITPTTNSGTVSVDIADAIATSLMGGLNTASSSWTISYRANTATTKSPTSYKGGGGGGTSSPLIQDICPQGDNSPSYYDNQCDRPGSSESTKPVAFSSNTTSPIAGGEKKTVNKCYYSDGVFIPENYNDIKGSIYTRDVISLLERCIFHGQADSQQVFSIKRNITNAEVIKAITRAYFLLPSTFDHFAREKNGFAYWWSPYHKALITSHPGLKKVLQGWGDKKMSQYARKSDIVTLLRTVDPSNYKQINISGKTGLSRGKFANILMKGVNAQETQTTKIN